jgi:hypothetical protein
MSVSKQACDTASQTHVYYTVPVLGTVVLDEPFRRLDRCNGSFHGQYELFELGEKVGCPSVSCVDDCSCPHNASVSGDCYPASTVSL